jgi:2-amino-4-hydroxy-6-hydroxymethyldihydropteridine diphosphokinase
MAFIYLSVGSNTGDRDFNLQSVLTAVEAKIGRLVAVSKTYESRAWGYEGQDYLNLAVKVETEQDPYKILSLIHEIEFHAGRIRTPGQYTDRPADIDILFMDQEIIQSNRLVVPHPHLQDRLFVLVPMMDIEPGLVHPVLKKTIRQLRDECRDTGWIRFHSEIR